MELSEHPTSEQASEMAVHKAKSAAMAIELSRQVQLEETIQKTALQTKAALLEGLKEVFGDGDNKDPDQMKILVRRIPILCTSVEAMHQNIKEIKDNQTWIVRLIIGAFVISLLKLILIP